MDLNQAIKEMKQWVEDNYDDDFISDGDALDRLQDECGQMSDGSCSMAGSEYCDWECPFS